MGGTVATFQVRKDWLTCVGCRKPSSEQMLSRKGMIQIGSASVHCARWVHLKKEEGPQTRHHKPYNVFVGM